MPAEMVKFRTALLTRGIALNDFGRMLGLSDSAIYSLASNGFSEARSLRWKIEAKLDYAEAIWTTKDVLLLRQKCHAATGVDPFLADKSALLALAQKFEVCLADIRRTVPGLRDAIIAKLSVNRHLLTPRTA